MPELSDKEYKLFQAFLAQQEAAEAAKKPAPREELYVHLANGDVERVFADDNASGLVDGRKHFIKDGNAHHVIGVYPVETKTETTVENPED